MPIPVSRTEKANVTRSGVRSSTATATTTSPRSVNFTALFTRLIRIEGLIISPRGVVELKGKGPVPLVEIFASTLTNLTPKQFDYLTKVRSAAGTLLGIIND